MKAVHGLWQDIRVGSLNRILKPFGVRLVVKTSKEWGKAVTVTAHELPPSLVAQTAGVVSIPQAVKCNHSWRSDDGGQTATCVECGVPRD